jgi:hypothetical protein
MPTTWCEERILNGKNERPGCPQEVSTQCKQLNTWVEILAGNEKWINADNEIEFVIPNDRFNETVNNLNVCKIATTSARALNELFACLKRYNLKPSLSEVPRKVTSATSDLKNARSSW